MKQKTLLFSLLTGFFCVVLSSYKDGPAAPANASLAGNRTGSAGTTATCGGGGCHANNNAGLAISSIAITDTSNTTALTSYVPGKKYMLRILATTTSLSQSKFGFQISTVKSASTSTQAGTMAVGGNSTANTAIHTVGGIQIFEHVDLLNGTGGGTSWAYTASCYWTAPAAGTGTVKLYGIVNAVNGDNNTSGDAPNASTATINEGSSSVGTTVNKVDFSLYPNPATTSINVSADGIGNGTCNVYVYDMRGKLIAAQDAEAINGTMTATINSSKWAAGMYFVQVAKDGQYKVIPVEKQ